MSRQLFWKLCLVVALGVVALFWGIDTLSSHTEDRMSYLHDSHREEIRQWGHKAEQLFADGDPAALEQWLDQLQKDEQTLASVAHLDIQRIGGTRQLERYYEHQVLGRSVDWKIHLYLDYNPIMEVVFTDGQYRFLVQLPDRMRPGGYLDSLVFSQQVLFPLIILLALCYLLYQHIMRPINQLKAATKSFSQGALDVRVRALLGRRSDELSELAEAFDQMTARIGELILSQRQLISELSHELRTPLTRLDIAIEQLSDHHGYSDNIQRLERESRIIRKLIDDSLTFAWLDNERPELRHEEVNLNDLLDVLIDDARFEFADRQIIARIPLESEIHNSNHRALGQALENVIRNALRFTPPGEQVEITLQHINAHWCVQIIDQGPGISCDVLEHIFKPFYRVEPNNGKGFGLGLALAQRQIAAVGGLIRAYNRKQSTGLCMEIFLPAHR